VNGVSSGSADEPRDLVRGAAAVRGRRALVAPAVFLLVATIAIVLARGALHHAAKTAVVSKPVAAAPHRPAVHRLYRVRAGDTLARIAARTGVPLARLLVLNPGLQPTALFIGEKIRLT
jgi:LysM repeat protein